MNKQEIEKAIAYWKEFKSEIPGLKVTCQFPDLDLDEQEKFTDLAISALEKQIPKKPKNIRNITFTGSTRSNFSEGECPNCGEYVDTDDNRYVCGQSGCYQAIDWSVEE